VNVSVETAVSIALGIGLAAATGLRVFLPLLVLSIAAKFGGVTLGQNFSWLASDAATLTLTVATLVEIAAYYVPGLDHVLDVLAAPLALIAGTIAMAAVLTDMPPYIKWAVAIIAGAGAAGLTQGASTAVRAKSGLFTGGIGNPLVATAELGGATTLSLLAIFWPMAALIAVVLLVLMLLGLRRVLFGARVKPNS
jgi:Domain of unknown function (DUF4126)